MMDSSAEDLSEASNNNNSESESEDESFNKLITKLRSSRTKEIRHSEEKVIRLESLLLEKQAELEGLRKTVKELKSQEFQKKAKYEETSSAASLTSSDDEGESESDFEDEGIESGPNTSMAEPSHPLLIDPILETIMKFLPLNSLLTSRIVCKKWYKFAHKYLVAKSDPVILEVYQPWIPSRGNKLWKFLEVMKNGIEGCPVSKYVLRSFGNLTELDKFFRKLGPTVKYLDLTFTQEFDDNSGFRRILFEYAPFIESLRIECCKMLEKPHFWEFVEFEASSSKLRSLKTLYIGNIRDGVQLNADWIQEFLTMTPNLEKLILQVNFKENGHAFIQEVLNSLLKVGNLGKIKSIMISSLTEQHLQTLIQLAEKGLRLRTFRFQDLCLQTLALVERISSTTAYAFFQSQSESLQTLKISQSSNRIQALKFPPMPAMKTLTLSSDQDLTCGYLNYAQQFPNLESLTLRGFGVFSVPHYFSESSNQFPAGLNLTRLSLPSGIRNEPFPRFLASMFPNIKELEVRGASSSFLRSIWEAWPGLEKFKIVVSIHDGNLDSGITGIEEEECVRITRLDYDEFQNVELDEIQDGPSITDLKNLRELEIECRSLWIPCNLITDVSGYFAFSNMPQLKSFKFTEIGVPEKFDFSDDCILRIHERLPDTELTFKIMDDHGRWQMELGEADGMINMYETEPLLEDHNKDRVFCYEKR